jgi:hypothetical protein
VLPRVSVGANACRLGTRPAVNPEAEAPRVPRVPAPKPVRPGSSNSPQRARVSPSNRCPSMTVLLQCVKVHQRPGRPKRLSRVRPSLLPPPSLRQVGSSGPDAHGRPRRTQLTISTRDHSWSDSHTRPQGSRSRTSVSSSSRSVGRYRDESCRWRSGQTNRLLECSDSSSLPLLVERWRPMVRPRGRPHEAERLATRETDACDTSCQCVEGAIAGCVDHRVQPSSSTRHASTQPGSPLAPATMATSWVAGIIVSEAGTAFS